METYLGTAVLFVLFLGHCSCSCPIGTYGFLCGYQCHCLSQDCDHASRCNPGNCFPGWSGATCHKYNAALNKAVSSSGDAVGFPSGRATDGRTGDRGYQGCIETKASNPNWWRVDLVDITLIRDVTIYFRTDYLPRRNGIQVYLTNTTITPSGHLCYSVTGNRYGTDINNTLSAPCHNRGRYVLLYTTTANDKDTQPILDFCEVEVNVCDPGTFGADCENYCHCKHGVCNYTTGLCPPSGCLAGWKGPNCDVQCVDNVQYGPDCIGTCFARMCKEAASTCPRDTGRCGGGCKPGWEGDDCTSECSGTYGDECSQNCSSRHCGTVSYTCDHVTGECDHGCSAGWKDIDCVTECIDGVEYGAGCFKNCSSRKCKDARSPCPRDTGRCDGGCQPGWGGEDCRSECTLNVNYGPGCHGNCNARKCKDGSGMCPRDTGLCDGGCQPGWEGVDCSLECTPNLYYGSGCHGNCSSRKCKDVSDTCPRDTGRCDGGCESGWEGVDCTLECTLNVSYGPGCHGNCSARKCKEVPSMCPRDTGRCDGGCQPGWEGMDCTTECTLNVNYGPGCHGNCNARKCKDGSGMCPRDTGLCDGGCQPGWEGVDCSLECTPNLYYGSGCHGNCSSRKCKDVSDTCPRDTGRCDGGCESGWEGVDCTLECTLNVSYGPGCHGNCSARKCKEVSGECPHDTGRCDGGCQSGWEGVDCMLECPKRTFGVNCSSMCGHCVDNEPCHHVTGTCLKGCSPGWINDTCLQAQRQSSSSGYGPVVGGAVVAVAVVAVVTVLAVFFYRRKRNANKKRSDNSVYEDVSAFEPQEPQLHAVGPSVNAGYEEKEETDGDADCSGENTASTYYNIGPAMSTEVDVDKLGDRIRDMQATKQGFEKEYQKLISGFTHTYEASQLEGNTGKNRFLQYYPYDYNRVVLDKLPEDLFSDYINASYINGFSRDKAYIAAQAPNKKTVTDFWRMIYQKNLTRIVMLTNLTEMGKVKCEPYWSDTRDLEAGPFSISVTKVIQRSCWVIRELTATVKQTGEYRIFYQFHFTKWPDHGTPDETHLMEFLWRVRKTPNPDASPLLVHCSAGIGRTGTYIALDYLLDRALSEHKVDVFRFACDMRRQRRNMIQTKEQYACVYTTLYEVLTVGDTFLTSLDFVEHRGRKTVFRMGNLTIPRLIQRVKSDIQRSKTGKDIKGRVWVNGRADILAVMMPSHLSMNGYLLTEAPSVTTASLFWKLTEEQESSTIIVLPDSHQRVSCFLPAPGESLDLGPASITCSTENAINPDIVFRNIQRQIQGDASSQTVRVYMMMIFPTDDHSVLLDLLEQVDLGRRDNTPNPVTVVFGEKEKRVATLFCILSNIVLGIRYDNEVEIYNNIRRLGHLHANDLTQEEISVCYNLASTYLETQSVYANM
ncbi:uncharacterized protein [Haliotis asinina]|uniref:uncharacterized protein n=1 Tax=Haliotis asinina TaxID=109174 RepID=UPI003531EEFC